MEYGTTGTYVPYGITQYYLPSGRGDISSTQSSTGCYNKTFKM